MCWNELIHSWGHVPHRTAEAALPVRHGWVRAVLLLETDSSYRLGECTPFLCHQHALARTIYHSGGQVFIRAVSAVSLARCLRLLEC